MVEEVIQLLLLVSPGFTWTPSQFGDPLRLSASSCFQRYPFLFQRSVFLAALLVLYMGSIYRPVPESPSNTIPTAAPSSRVVWPILISTA